MNKLMWALPGWVHDVVLALTSYRLVKQGDVFFWTAKWPL